MKEYGSFFELDLLNGKEFYHGQNLKRLNIARCGIFYVLKLLGLNKILIPYYQCPTVRNFLLSKNIEISYFNIDEDLLPILPPKINCDTAVLIVNYFGILPSEKIKQFSKRYKNLIIDNSQAFYKSPIDNTYTVYSPRKFFGVSDGCYVIGQNAGKEDFAIQQDFSSDTSLFLLSRIEKGCEASYEQRQINEARLDNSDMLNMSELTKTLLKNINYLKIKKKRLENFHFANNLFKNINMLNTDNFNFEPDTVPMVYPLMIKDENIINYLVENKVFIGRWWSYLTNSAPKNSIEMRLSRYMLPLPIDQRLDKADIERIYQLVTEKYQ